MMIGRGDQQLKVESQTCGDLAFHPTQSLNLIQAEKGEPEENLHWIYLVSKQRPSEHETSALPLDHQVPISILKSLTTGHAKNANFIPLTILVFTNI